MYAQIDNINFEPLNSFDGFSDDEEAVWAEHAPITGKPILQPTGLNARELNISIRLRQEFADIRDTTSRLRMLMREHKVCPLIWGTGEVEGYFVILRMGRAFEEQDKDGNVYGVSVSLSLKEYAVVNPIEITVKSARLKAGAVGANATETKNPKKNLPTDKQKVVANLMKARRTYNVIKALTVSATDAYNGGITPKLIFLGNALGGLKLVSALRGPATDRSKHFDTSVGNAQDALSGLQGMLPVTGGNKGDFEQQLNLLGGKMDGMMVFGGIFQRQVSTRREKSIIEPFTGLE